MGLVSRRTRNIVRKIKTKSIPEPGFGAGLKNWRRFHQQNQTKPIAVKNPERYLSPAKRQKRAAA